MDITDIPPVPSTHSRKPAGSCCDSGRGDIPMPLSRPGSGTKKPLNENPSFSFNRELP